MSNLWSVSLSKKDQNLADWVNDRIKNNELSPSDVFKEAMLEKKKDWDILQSVSPEQMQARINFLEKETKKDLELLKERNEFISSIDLSSKFWDFIEKKREEEKRVKVLGQNGHITINEMNKRATIVQ